MTNLRATPGSVADIPSFLDLLEEAGSWLWARGIRQWEPGSNRLQEGIVRAQVERGALLLARDEDGIAGGCVLTTLADPVWEGREAQAVTLHKLAVARRASGQGLGGRIVAAAEAWTRDAGYALLRLDCWDGNARLRAYYRELSFTELSAVPSHGASVRLFEKHLV